MSGVTQSLVDLIRPQIAPFRGRVLWIGFSGGIDSHVLLHALSRLRLDDAFTLRPVHIDHGLHEASGDWADHCQSVCSDLGMECAVVSIDVSEEGGDGPEAAARRARYRALATLIGSNELLLTAHHAQDQAETILMHLLKGAGTAGLRGMRRERPFGAGVLLRPLLGVSPDQIQDYASTHGLEWIEDPSNRGLRHDRNFVRHRLWPLMQERWPGMLKTLVRAGRHAEATQSILDGLADDDLEQLTEVPGPMEHFTIARRLAINPLRRIDQRRQANALRRWIATAGVRLPNESRLLEIIHQLVNRNGSSGIVAWDEVEVRKYRDALYLLHLPLEVPRDELPWRLGEPIRLPGDFGDLMAEPATGEGVSVRAIGRGDAAIRWRRGGERLRLGTSNHQHQALKKILQAEKVPPWVRERLPLVCLNGEVVCVPGVVVARPFRPGADEPGIVFRFKSKKDTLLTN